MVSSPLSGERAGPARVVGVVFDDRHIQAVEVQRSPIGRRRRPAIRRAATAPLGPDVVAHGEIVDPERFADALRALWKRGGFKTKNVAIGLDGRATVIRQADLPALAPKDLAQAAAYDIGELLSYPLDEAVVSMIEIGRRDHAGVEMVRTVTLAARQDDLTELHQAARRAGLRPVTTELVASALVAAVDGPTGNTPTPDPAPERGDPEPQDRGPDDISEAGSEPVEAAEPAPTPIGGPEDDGVGALVHVSSTMTMVVVHDERGLEFSRVITAGVDVDETSLSDELEMELAMLEGFASGQADAPSRAAGGAGPGITTVVEGIRRTLHYYTTEVDERPVTKLVLCGPQSGVGGLAAAIGESVPDARILRHRFNDFPDGVDDVSSYDAATSVAIAASVGTTGLRRFDLVPAPVRERRTARRRAFAGAAVAAAVAPLLVADALGRRADTNDRAAEANAVEVAVDSLRSELDGYQEVEARIAVANRATDRVNALNEQEYGFPVVIRRMAETMPDDTFLISFRLARSTSGEAPTGYSGEPPPATLALTGVAGDLDGVGRWIQTVDEVPAVDGLWLSQAAAGPYGASEEIASVFTVDGALVSPAAVVERIETLEPTPPDVSTDEGPENAENSETAESDEGSE